MKTLSPCQKIALKILNEADDNVFLTGSAGSGKSFLIREFLKGLDYKFFPVVASTGVAAVLIRGRTFHSFFGLGIMEGGPDKTISRAMRDGRLKRRLNKIVGFVLDEVSMISGATLSCAEQICRQLREDDRPWGGLRIIAVGDFAQLPPVNPRSEEKEWAFLDEVWERSQFTPVILKTMMRSEDEEYLKILNSIREGFVDDTVRAYLKKHTDPSLEDLKTTRLFSRRNVVDNFNQVRLKEIDNPLKEFPTTYLGNARAIESLKKSAPIPEVLKLKKNALVMIRENDPGYAYVNGSIGTIEKIEDDVLQIKLKNGRIVEIEPTTFSSLNADGKELAAAKNFPISLAYATTIHKAQGATLDSLVADLRGLWEPGQAYVALSRLRSGEGLTLTGWDERSIQVDPDVARFHQNL